LALLLAAGASLSWGAETVTVNKALHGREIKVRVGGLVKVELDQAGATGFEWQARGLEGGLLEVVSVETSGPSAPELTGAPVRKTWLLKAARPGLAELRFLFYRSWEGEQSAADTFELKVRIP
jgi:predicted secreted protein